MADLKLLAILSTGKPGVPSDSNYGLITKLKVGNVTLEGDTVDGVDVALLKSDFDTLDTAFGTHDGGTAKAQHSAIGDHTHASAGAEGGTIDHGNLTGRDDDDHTIYAKADGTRAFTGTVSGVTPTSDAHLATKGYTDSVASGLKVLKSVRVRAQGNINISAPGATIDGVTMAVDDRVLVDQQSTGSEDGIYLWKGAAAPMVRTDDAQSGAAFAGRFTFVQEGTADADVGYVCTNDSGSDVVGTDNLAFTQFSTPGSYTGGDGIDITSLTIKVDLATDPGLQFTSQKLDLKIEANKGLAKGASGLAGVADNAKGIEVGASGFGITVEASNPSLQLASNELGVKFDANGGLQKTASGTGVKIDDTPDTLDVDSSGLKVVGLPSQFKINGSQVSANVTQANLDELTGGTATTLHSHTAVASHALGGSSHSADTIANLNSKISDLIATYGAVRDVGVGTDAQRPVAGTAGRFWWSTDSDKLYYDNGAAWDTIVATPSSHASSHQDGGADEVATATPGANAIPKAGAGGKLAAGWIQEVLAYADLTDDPVGTHAALTTGTHGAGGNTLEHTGNKGTASGYASLNASTKVVEDPANATATPTASKIPIADGTGKLAAGWISEVLAYSDLTDDPLADHSAQHENSGSDEISVAGLSGQLADDQPALAHTIGGAKHSADTLTNLNSKISGGKTLVAKEDANTWSGAQHFNGETTVDVLIGDGNYAGIQIPRTVGTGGITAGDVLTFDGTGQIIRRSGADQIACGIAATTTAASSTGYYVPMGLGKALFTTGKEPSSPGQNVFTDNTPGNYHKLTTDVQTDGIVYSAIAIETGALAKVIWMSRRVFAFE